MSKIFWNSSFSYREIIKGWYYEYKNYVGGPYDNQKQAEASLMVRIINTKPQRGRSDPLSVKP